MSLEFYTGYALDPNALPSVSGAASGVKYLVAHRVLVKGGLFTAISSYAPTGFSFPMTVTCPTYFGDFEAYQILVSNDSGANWRLAYTGTNRTKTLQSFDANWVISNPNRTIAPGLALLDLGTFSATESPSTVIHAKALTSASLMRVSAKRVSGQTVPELYGRLFVEYLGKYANTVGNGNLDISDANSTIYDHPYLSSNTLTTPLSQGEVGAFRVSLIAYDATVPIDVADGVQLRLDTGFVTYPLPLAPRQASKAFIYDGFPTYTSTGLNLKVKPFQLARFGGVISSPEQDIVLPASSTTQVYVDYSGALTFTNTGFSIGSFTTSGAAVTAFQPKLPFLSPDTRVGQATAPILFGQLINSSFAPGNYVGVALHDAATGKNVEYSAKGPTWVKTNSTFSMGDLVYKGSGGLASSSPSGSEIGYALTSTIGGYVLTELAQTATAVGGGGGSTDLSVINRTATTLTVASNTGDDATIPSANTSQAGLLSAADKVALDALVASGGGSSPDVLVSDNFVGANGDSLTGRTPQVGPNWTTAVNGTTTPGVLTIQSNKVANLNSAGYGDAFIDTGDFSYNVEFEFGKVGTLGTEHIFLYLRGTGAGNAPYNYVAFYSVSDNSMGFSIYSNSGLFKTDTKTVTINSTGNKVFAQVRTGYVRVYFNDVLFGVYATPASDIFFGASRVGVYMPGGSQGRIEKLVVTRS